MLKSFEPLINNESEILILGSMPGIKSLEASEYYAHPQNRFWKIMGVICNYPDLEKKSYEIKTKTLLKNKIALWDTVKNCTREGSLDSNIQNIIPTNILALLSKYPKIRKICCNGAKSYSFFGKYSKNIPKDIEVIALPSTSPANARYSFDKLLTEWKCIK